MKKFDEECSAISAYKECGEDIMKSVGIDAAKVEAAFKKSFNGEENSYLKKNKEVLLNAGMTSFPAVTINGVKIKGSLYVTLPLPRPSSFSTIFATPCSPRRLPARSTCRPRHRSAR